MSAGPQFDLDHDPAPGVVEQVSPLIRRVTANNPGKFTFKGTGTYIVGEGEVALIDPGPDDPAHVEALLDSLRRDTVTHILITHTHRDHSPAAAALADATGARTFAFGPHPPTARDPGTTPTGEDGEEGGDTDFTPDNLLDDGDVLAGPDWTLEAIHTPGHISNHLCFALRQESALFTGDHIMGWSTTIIPPPDGSLDSYLSSLDVVLGRDEGVLWPTHGPAVRDPHDFVEALRDHRLERNNQILRCISSGLGSIDAMVEVMYSDKPAELHKPAARSVLAHLIHLVDEDRVDCEGEPGLETVYSQP